MVNKLNIIIDCGVCKYEGVLYNYLSNICKIFFEKKIMFLV